MTIDDLKGTPIYVDMLRVSHESNPDEGDAFHELNACAAVAASIAVDAMTLSDDLCDFASDFKIGAFDDEDLEGEEDLEHCGMEPDNTGASGAYDDFEDGERSNDCGQI